MNAVQLLKEDHERAERLFHQFQFADDDSKAEIASEICRTLTIHALIEEELLYPAARDTLGEEGAGLIDEALVEHATVKKLIGEIESADSSDALFHAKVKVLGQYVKHHVREEEGELFPQLEDSQLDLDGLGSELESRKAELMGETDDEREGDTATRRIAPEPNDRGTPSNRSPAR